jgi:hypothetical protein
MIFLRIISRFNFLFEHDLFPKTGSHFSGSCSNGYGGDGCKEQSAFPGTPDDNRQAAPALSFIHSNLSVLHLN